MKDIASIIRLDCNEEIDIRYFTKNGSISDTTCDYSELLDYINGLEDRIDKAIEYINKYESIKAYYEYEECGYEEYNYDNDFKDDLLEILRGKDEYKLPFDEEVQSGLDSLSIRGKDEREGI